MDFSTVQLFYLLLWEIQNLWLNTWKLFRYLLLILAKLVAARVAVRWWFSNSVILSVFISWPLLYRRAFSPCFPPSLSSLFLPFFLLCQCGLVDSCVIQWAIIHYHHNSFWWWNCPLFGSGSFALGTRSHHFKALLCFLAQQDVPGLFYTFSVPDLKSAISLRNFGSFYWEVVLRNKDQGISKYES